MVRVNKNFIVDFDYLADHYNWNAEDREEMKNWIRSAPEINVPYIVNLAAQWRAAEGIAA